MQICGLNEINQYDNFNYNWHLLKRLSRISEKAEHGKYKRAVKHDVFCLEWYLARHRCDIVQQIFV